MSLDHFMTLLGILVILPPAILLATLGLSTLVNRPLGETWTSRLSQVCVSTGLAAAVVMLVMMLTLNTRFVPIELGNLVTIPQQHFHFHLKFVFDRLSVPFVILSYVLGGTVGAFTTRYLHRERGYNRFSLCYAFFMLGMIVTSLAGTIEVLFLGWELVGLSSALLVAYFHERPSPVINGLRVWTVYRLADAAFLIAAVAMHHLTGEGDFSVLMGSGPWPAGKAALTGGQAIFVGALLLIAAAGKSAMIPFSGWLPRAMEGPTPSSAIFYGALSVHLGAFLLLRVSPILEQSVLLSVLVVLMGLTTALYAAITARVQSDIKSSLAYASLTQVGIIVAEIGFGLRYIALIHIIGHACLRTVQVLRAPTLLRDYQTMENAIGGRLHSHPSSWQQRLSPTTRVWWYRFAFERGYFDSFLNEYIVAPFQAIFEWCDGMERRWTDFLAGGQSRESDVVEAQPHVVEQMEM
ncbi:MAG: proton-conducting transporter membrane subunit [Planctomycetaceae bacterium]